MEWRKLVTKREGRRGEREREGRRGGREGGSEGRKEGRRGERERREREKRFVFEKREQLTLLMSAVKLARATAPVKSTSMKIEFVTVSYRKIIHVMYVRPFLFPTYH